MQRSLYFADCQYGSAETNEAKVAGTYTFVLSQCIPTEWSRSRRCLFRSSQVVISRAAQDVLQLIHAGHQGNVAIKRPRRAMNRELE